MPHTTSLEQVDLAVLRFFVGLHGGSETFSAVIGNLAGNDLVKGGLFITAMWWYFFKPHDALAKRRELIVVVMGAALLAAAASRAIAKLGLGHVRPFLTPGLDLPVAINTLWEEKASSFPSDHASLGFALVTGLFLLSRPVGIVAGAWALLVVCAPRICLGIHWPSDILGGMLLGISVGVIVTRERVRAALARPAMAVLDRRPAVFYAGLFLLSYGLTTRFDDIRSLVRLAAAAPG